MKDTFRFKYFGDIIVLFLAGYFLYLFLLLPAMYIVPWFYEIFMNVTPACGIAIRNGIGMNVISECSNVEFNLHAILVGLIAVIIGIIYTRLNKSESR